MTPRIPKPNFQFIAGTLLVVPALYFFVSAFLHFEMHVSPPWNLIGSYFDRPENKTLGWNANLLIAFGPLLAILINLPGLVQFRLYRNEDDKWQLAGLANLNSPRWLVISSGVFFSGLMIAYLLTENCGVSKLKTGTYKELVQTGWMIEHTSEQWQYPHFGDNGIVPDTGVYGHCRTWAFGF